MTPRLLVLATLAAALLPGCKKDPAKVKNGTPSALIVAVRPNPATAGELLVDLYVRDLERDPVSLEVVVVPAGQAAGPCEPTSCAALAGLCGTRSGLCEAAILTSIDEGTEALVTEPGVPGALYRLRWEASALDPARSIQLLVTPRETARPEVEGLTDETDPFTRSAGWTRVPAP